ncbi:MAG: esterase-like activity of phytase family protein [Bacteroidia bacterium]
MNKNRTIKKLILLIGMGLSVGLAQAQTEMKHLSSYETAKEESSETVAYDVASKRAFFTNTSTNSLSIINIADPKSPVLFKDVDLSTYGGGPNSVASHNGIIAVAIENNTKTSNGVVVFFDNTGLYLGQVTVGALPDMLTFSPDGKKLLVANEGEPNDDYTIDPNGSISIIDMSNGVSGASVVNLDFTSYNDKKHSLMNKGIRIFGNNGTATVAQDMEPEFITITEDGKKAYVNCQENNGLAVIDLSTNTLLDILPLGFKNHSLGSTKVESYILNELVTNWPSLGTPVYGGGQPDVKLGGFSGLYFDEAASTSTDYVFYAVPDRGPNGNTVAKASVTPAAPQNLRPFKLPNYQGRIVKFTLNKNTGAITLGSSILLTRKDGTTPISGKGNIPGFDEVPVTITDVNTAYANSDYVNGADKYHALPYDEFGGDFEGVLKDKDGNFWLCDEYRPAIYKFAANGKLIERFVPKGTSTLGTTPMPAGTYGAETLPEVYSKRWANRGFEAIAYDMESNTIYAFIQSPLYNPSSITKDNSDVIRILGINANTGLPVSEYVYLLERNKYAGYASSRVDKIGDAVYTGNGKFLVIERDSEGPEATTGKKYVFEIDIHVATNILNNPIANKNGFTIEEVKHLGESAKVINENSTPFALPTGFSQSKVVDRNKAKLDADFASTFGNWDMISLDPSNAYIYIPLEVGTGGGLTRYEISTGDFVTALKGNNTGVFESDPNSWDPTNDDFGGVDPAVWTPHNTVVTAEEWAGNGRLFEWMNPLMHKDSTPIVKWRSNVPSVSHEGVKFSSNGVMYFVDENNSGSLYKFVPKTTGDLSVGQTYVLKVDAYNGDASKDWNHSSNSSASRTGAATWVAMTDANGAKTTTADPFDFTNRGGRAAADELNATPYGRPEDLEINGNTLYLAVTSENSVYSFDLSNASTSTVKVFANQSTVEVNSNAAIGSGFDKVDNLAIDAQGNIYVVEDNSPGDIWKAKDNNSDGVAETLELWASLGVDGAEPTGLISTNNANEFLVCIQHPSSGNDAIWKITTSGNANLTERALLEDKTPFLLSENFTQKKIVDRNKANLDADFASTFGNWDMISLDPSNNFIFIPLEVGTGGGLTRYDMTTGDFVTALKGNNSGVFESDPSKWDATNDDFGGVDPALWTPHSTVLTAEEWAGNGRLFEWLNPLMDKSETPLVYWRDNIPSVSHEGLKFDANGVLYFIDENTSGSVYKFVPKTVGDLSVGQTFVLKVDAYNGDASKNWNDASNTGTSRTGAATWIAMTDENGMKLTTADPFDFTSRGGRTAADELNATPYGRPEDLEIRGNTLFLATTSEHRVYSFDLSNPSTSEVKLYLSRATYDLTTKTNVGTTLANPDNLTIDAQGNIFVIEDNSPGDIWKTFDKDMDGVADSMTRWASLSVDGAEPTGLIPTNDADKFLVCIQHPSTGNDAIWEIDINSVKIADNGPDASPLETLSADEIFEKGIYAVHKNKVLNLPSTGYASSDKAEGIALLPNNQIAVINDNDFGLAGAGITDNSVLGIISFNNDYGFDASDKDNAVNITSHPTLGMFMPDGIKSYTVGGKTYIVTVNEGDSRDYDGYSEEVRVKNLNLDSARYPNASALQADDNLGRLKTTEANGDYDNDGDYDQIYSYGARSFSIFDEYGNLVFDSKDELAKTVLSNESDLFNEDDGEKDGRSDDKGVEPEAIEIATIGANTYAFIGLERQSAILMYDITDPKAPKFITYYNNREVDGSGTVTGDVSPEIIKFIPASESPNKQNLILVGYEVSGSMGIIQIGEEVNSISDVVKNAQFSVYPNPVSGSQELNFSKELTGEILSVDGKTVLSFTDASSVNTSELNRGVYIIKTENKGSLRFLKL